MILLFSFIVYSRNTKNQYFIEIIKVVTINAFFFFGYAYLTAYLLLPIFLSKKYYFIFALSFIISGFLISYLKFICSDFIFYSSIAADIIGRIQKISFSQILINTKDMCFIVAVFLIAKYTKDNHHLKIRLGELQDQQIRSELKILKNQMDPHVVFNNLNNIYCLALNNSESLVQHIVKFKSVLSYYFTEGNESRVPLLKELEAIDDYISLEKLRYGDRLSFTYNKEGDPENIFITPFVLFTFVENCFEHGCSIETGKTWIKLLIKIESDSLTFHASNSKPENVYNSTVDTCKHEYNSMKNKLNLLYPGKNVLRIDDRNDAYYLDLKLRF